VKGIPQRVLGSASYQVGKMDVLNVSASSSSFTSSFFFFCVHPVFIFSNDVCFLPQGTPALFLILLLYNSSSLSAYIEDERWARRLFIII